MAQVDLSALSGPELRRLLDTTRARGDAALSYQVLQEMAARRDAPRPRGLLSMRRPSEPRVVSLNLGDPMDPQDELPPLPGTRPPPEPEPVPAPPRRSRQRKTAAAAAPAPKPQVEPAPEPTRPRSVWDADPAPPEDEAVAKDSRLRLHAPGLETLRAAGLRGRGPSVGFAAGIAVGIALGFLARGTIGEAPSPAPAAVPVQTAAPAPQPAPTPPPAAPAAAEPRAAPEPAPEAAPEPLAEAPPAVEPPAAEPVAQAPAGEALELPVAPPRQADACAAEPTPADRTICGDPELRRLQRDLRQAYAEALAAHEERALLRERQLAWANARDAVTDPDRLARLYEQRIRRLDAATEAARGRR